MMKFWIITIIKANGATFVHENRVHTDLGEARKAWDECPMESSDEVELWECTNKKMIESK